MKLLESYANNCSVDIENVKPNLPIQYYPTPDKYITVQNSSGMPAKDYSLWQEVIYLIQPYLEQENIKIIQIGVGEILPLNFAINLLNQTSFAQSVYILRNALLHAGNDSYAAHAACTVPVVTLYGSTSVSAHSPFYFNSKSKFLESHRNGKNPSFQAQENPKTIDYISPESVAKSILDTLEIKNNITQKTLYVGSAFSSGHSIDVLPDAIINGQSIAPGILNLRADLYFDINGIIGNIQQRAYALHLNQEIDINLLKQLKQNIPAIIYEIDETTDPKYLKEIIKIGISLNLWTKLSEEDHDKIKLDYLDLPFASRREDVTAEQIQDKINKYQNSETKIPEKIKFFSRKHYLSNGKIYQSLFSWKIQKDVPNIESFSVGDLNDQDFKNEYEYFLVFEE